MPGADEADQLALAEHALVRRASRPASPSASSASTCGSRSTSRSPALVKLPVDDIVRAHRPQAENWPGLIIDLTEEQIVKEISACLRD